MTPVIFWIIYQGIIAAAQQWGNTVKAAFDLHRHHLCKELYLDPSNSFEKERERWMRVSSFFLYGVDYPELFDDFMIQSNALYAMGKQVK